MFNPKKNRYRIDGGRYCIDMRMNSPHQLFDERDPAPFRERDLDEDAVDYIIGSIQDLPQKAPVKIVLTFPLAAEEKVHTYALRDAIHSFFEYETEKVRRDINFLVRRGQFSLFAGVLFLAACLAVSHSVRSESFWGLTMHEGLTIIGWVAMWQPINIFLYDWWPLAIRMRLYKRVMQTEVIFQFLPEALPIS
jgi:hypothetical protein